MNRAQRLSAATWRRHKQEIIQRYINDDETLEEVMSVMARKHGFAPTKPQYKRQLTKWGIQKNKLRMECENEAAATEGAESVSSIAANSLNSCVSPP